MEEQYPVNVTTKMFPEGRVGERLLTVRANSVEEAEELHRHLVASVAGWDEVAAPESSAEAESKPAFVPPNAPGPASTAVPCPKCDNTRMYDNREKKRSGDYKPNASDFKCGDCNLSLWPEDYEWKDGEMVVTKKKRTGRDG